MAGDQRFSACSLWRISERPLTLEEGIISLRFTNISLKRGVSLIVIGATYSEHSCLSTAWGLTPVETQCLHITAIVTSFVFIHFKILEVRTPAAHAC